MHSFERDIGTTSYRSVTVKIRQFLCIGILLLLFAPIQFVYAQPSTPTPRPSSPQELQILENIAAHLDNMSASSDTTANAATLLMGGAFFVLMMAVLIVVVWIARGGLSRVWDIITVERMRANNAEQSETHMRIQYEDRDRKAEEYRTRTAEALEKTSAAQERTATTLSNLETKDEAERRQKAVQDNSNAARDDIKQHTHEEIAPVKEAADNTLASVKSIEAKVDKLMTKEEFTEQLRPVRNDIAELRKAIEERLLPPLAPLIDHPPPSTPAPP